MSRRISEFKSYGLPDEVDEYFRGACGGEGERYERLRAGVRRVMLLEMTEPQRRCVELCYFGRLRLSDAAALLGVNKSTVSRHLKRAREKLAFSLKYDLY